MSPLRENKAADGSLRVAVIGAGGVATSLVPALAAGGARVTQVFSRTLNNARRVAATVAGCEAIDTLALLTREADVYVIAVKDDAIARVLDEAIAVAGNDGRQPLWLHTSGSTSIDVFGGRVDRCGVLYPMQSFSRSLRVEMSEVYFFTEGNNEPTQARVDAFARLMSPHVTPCDSRRIQCSKVLLVEVFFIAVGVLDFLGERELQMARLSIITHDADNDYVGGLAFVEA